MPVQLERTVDYLRTLAKSTDADAELLRRFVQEQDQAAFALLVERHGALVLSVCRRIVQQEQDAEDAFQATFLVLARRASAIRKRASLSSWLHGVAFRVASKLKVQQARRRAGDQALGQRAAPAGDDLSWREVRGLLDAELERLPEHLRAPLVLCYLEGKTRDESAAELGWSLSTLRGRLERGRQRLRSGLMRAGVVVSAPLLAAALSQRTLAAPPVLLTVHTVKNALRFAAARQVGLIPNQVITLAREALPTMTQLKTSIVIVAFALLMSIGLLATGQAGSTDSPTLITIAPEEHQPAPVAPGLTPIKVEAQPAINNKKPAGLPPSVVVLTTKDHGKTIPVKLGQLIVVQLQYPPHKPFTDGGYAGGISPGKCTRIVYPGEGVRGKEIESLHKELVKGLTGERWMLAWFEAILPGMDDIHVSAAEKGGGTSNELRVKLNVANPYQSVAVERYFPAVGPIYHKLDRVELKDTAKVAALMAFLPDMGKGMQSSNNGMWQTRFRAYFNDKDGKSTTITISPTAEFWSEGKGDWSADSGLRWHLAEMFNDKAELDLLRMQGTWVLVKEETDDKPQFGGDGQQVLSVVETKLACQRCGQLFKSRTISVLDPKQSPRQILIVQEELDGKFTTIPGIYAVDHKDHPLKLCLAKPGGAMPKDFTKQNGQTVLYFTHPSAQPAAANKADPATVKQLQGTWRVTHFEAAGLKAAANLELENSIEVLKMEIAVVEAMSKVRGERISANPNSPETAKWKVAKFEADVAIIAKRKQLASFMEMPALVPPGGAPAGKPWQLVISGTMLTEKNTKLFTGGSGLSFKLDMRSTPHAIDLRPLVETENMPAILGIFKLEAKKEGDTLTICVGNPRPTEFVTTGHLGRTLIVLTRDKTQP